MKTTGSLVDWLLVNSTELKLNGCWRTHIRLGEKGLKQAHQQKRLHDRVKIALSMVSSYYYLGEYDNGLQLAEESGQYAQSHKKWPELIESYYLQSASERAKNSKEAIPLARKAMTVLDAHEPNNTFLRAKILYNLGSAYSDESHPDYDKAKDALKEALKLYTSLGINYEVVRTGMRLARVDYLMKDYVRALATLQTIETRLNTPRLEMHYHFQLAKILHRLDKWEQAYIESNKALVIARELNAKVDIRRVEALLRAINKRQYLSE